MNKTKPYKLVEKKTQYQAGPEKARLGIEYVQPRKFSSWNRNEDDIEHISPKIGRGVELYQRRRNFKRHSFERKIEIIMWLRLDF